MSDDSPSLGERILGQRAGGEPVAGERRASAPASDGLTASERGGGEPTLHTLVDLLEAAQGGAEHPENGDLAGQVLEAAIRLAGARGGFVARADRAGPTLLVARRAGADGGAEPSSRRLEQVAAALREARSGVQDAPPTMTGGLAPPGAVAIKADAGQLPVHAFPLSDPVTGAAVGVLGLVPAPTGPQRIGAEAASGLRILRAAAACLVAGAVDAAARTGQDPAAMLRYEYGELVTRSPSMHAIFRKLDRVIAAKVPVLIVGETGTGKELVARAIHENDPARRRRRFYTQNCGAIAPTLLESELFGYEKGAFTGAERRKQGLFEIASGSTLFLDEIGEMGIDMQTRLLRVLQEGEVVPLGATAPVPIDVRIVAATLRDLEADIKAGRFREDLYYRLKVVRIAVPPLRERLEDVPVLVDHFLAKTAREMGRPPKVLDRRDPRVLDAFARYSWPGNVRELENVIRRVAYLSDDVITYEALADADPHLVGEVGHAGAGEQPADEQRAVRNLDEAVEALERSEIENALRVTGGNRTHAAERLGINRRSLLRRLKKYGLGTDDDE